MRSMVEGAHAASAEELKDAVLGMDKQSPLPPSGSPGASPGSPPPPQAGEEPRFAQFPRRV